MEGHHLIGKLSLTVGEVGGGGGGGANGESDLTNGRPSFNWEVISHSGGGWGGGGGGSKRKSKRVT